MGVELISPNVDREADVFTIDFLHRRLGQDFPISGDALALARAEVSE
jgi:hypothetical protein